MDKMISLVMAVYNGSRYILEQLVSIYAQTKKIDEVIIIDDCSTDDSITIIETFIHNNKIEHWKVVKNKSNKGWKRSFQDGLCMSSGEYVFLCDQDDIWEPTKIEEMYRIIYENPSISLLVSSYTPFYEDDSTQKISSRIMRSMKNDGSLHRIPLKGSFMSVERPGCTYCVKRNLIDIAKTCWNDHIPHDATLWRVSILENSAYIYDKKLIRWRRYSNSNSNPERFKNQYNNQDILVRNNMYNNVILPDIEFLEIMSKNQRFQGNRFIQNQLELYLLRKKFYDEESFFQCIKNLLKGIRVGFLCRILIHDGIIVYKYIHAQKVERKKTS